VKNVVVCCDGTANEFAQHRTNVVKLYYTLVHDPKRQVAYYHPGLGTMEPPGALTGIGRTVTKMLGLAFGYGLSTDIRDAYVFIMNHFEVGDHLFLFGFSRGAYTVRVLAAMLKLYGLIPKGNDALVPYVVRMLMSIGKLDRRNRRRSYFRVACMSPSVSKSDVGAYFRLAGQFRKAYGTSLCMPHFVGVWDTVSSVGWISNPLTIPFTTNPHIRKGRHAVSIDERRAFFRENLWRSPTGNIQQVWFPGVHCDVGGGYPEGESGLSKVALRWMLSEATIDGLLVDRDRAHRVLGGSIGYVAPDPNGKLHQSLTLRWWIAELVPKLRYSWARGQWEFRANWARRRAIPNGAMVHDAAFQRGSTYAVRLPRDAVRATCSLESVPRAS
jgi:uncharacterized protein (DUF2235 family)